MNSQDLTTMKDIGKLIRDIRKQQGATQEELAGIVVDLSVMLKTEKTPLKQVNYYLF